MKLKVNQEQELSVNSLKKEIKSFSDKKKAELLQRYFKTGKGDYAEGDIFLGLIVPQCRLIAKKYSFFSLNELNSLISSEFHEERLIALLILVQQFSKAQEKQKKQITDFYLENYMFINNWDLVDLTAPRSLGEFLLNKDKKILFVLAKTDNLWKKRIAVLACFALIKNNDFSVPLEISEILLNDKHDLIHKAVGWMLRETGKKDLKTEEDFLKKHYKKMPRTMLRYAIEKFPEQKRKAYLKGSI